MSENNFFSDLSTTNFGADPFSALGGYKKSKSKKKKHKKKYKKWKEKYAKAMKQHKDVKKKKSKKYGDTKPKPKYPTEADVKLYLGHKVAEKVTSEAAGIMLNAMFSKPQPQALPPPAVVETTFADKGDG